VSQFKTIHEVPTGFRHLNGVPLTLEQVNQIIDAATADSTGPEDFAACLGKAKHAFRVSHEIVEGVWV
jgi:hypothetical protein